MSRDDTISRFTESLDRCLAEGDFVGDFYDRFLASSNEVRDRFAHTDFERQRRMLRSSLYLVARAAMGLEDGAHHLEHVARTHGPDRHAIPLHHYDLWLEALVATARARDPRWDEDVELAWRSVLADAVDRMTAAREG